MQMHHMREFSGANAGERGFTLLELMIVVAIIGIIAGIAFPAFSDYMQKARRSEAKTLLMGMAAREEQYFTDNRAYTAALGDLGYSTNADGSVSTEKGYYNVSAAVAGATFTLTAVPQGSQSGDPCANFTLDEAGVKDVTGTDNHCW